MGQLSDPYKQGEQDEQDELGITISGLPGGPGGPGDPPGDIPGDAAAGADPFGGATGETVVYDLEDWSEIERQAVSERLQQAGVPHAWDRTSLQVAAADEAPVDNVLDIVEDEAGHRLDAEREQVAYDLADWDDDRLDSLVDRLDEAGIAHAWGDDEMFVYADDEQAVDELLDQVAHPHELAAEPDQGTVGATLLGDIFLAADRLQRDSEDHEGTSGILDVRDRIDASQPPYGIDRRDWSRLCDQVSAVGTLLEAESIDHDSVMDSARELRTALRPYV